MKSNPQEAIPTSAVQSKAQIDFSSRWKAQLAANSANTGTTESDVKEFVAYYGKKQPTWGYLHFVIKHYTVSELLKTTPAQVSGKLDYCIRQCRDFLINCGGEQWGNRYAFVYYFVLFFMDPVDGLVFKSPVILDEAIFSKSERQKIMRCIDIRSQSQVAVGSNIPPSEPMAISQVDIDERKHMARSEKLPREMTSYEILQLDFDEMISRMDNEFNALLQAARNIQKEMRWHAGVFRAPETDMSVERLVNKNRPPSAVAGATDVSTTGK